MKLSKWQQNGLIAVLVILIFPFFALLQYVFPQSDDFFFAVKVHELGILSFVKYTYFNWSGRYASMFLGSLDPMAFKSIFLLRIELLLFMAFNFYSIFLLTKSLLKPILSSKKILIFSLVFYTIFLNAAPDTFELLFWYPAVTAYQFGISLLLIFIANMFFVQSDRIKPSHYLLLNSLIAIVAIGLMEIFIIPIILSILISIYLKYKNQKSIKPEIIILSFAIFSSIVVIVAPGNYVRLETESASNILIGIYLAIKSMIYILGYIFQNAVFVLGSILFISFPNKLIFKNDIFNFKLIKLHPLWSTLFLLLITFIMILPSTLATGKLPPGRVFNSATFIFYILWLMNLLNFKIYYNNKLSFEISNFYQKTIAFVMIMFVFSGVFVINPYEFSQKKKDSVLLYGNILNAYKTLLLDAKNYENDMNERYNSFTEAQNNKKKMLVVKPLEHPVEMLLFVDITNLSEPGAWIFNWEGKYYGMDSICIENNDTVIMDAIIPEISNSTKDKNQ